MAKERISPGEVIAVDRAALQVLTPDTVGSHCSHCMVSTLAPLYCPECHAVVFCSEACSTAALEDQDQKLRREIGQRSSQHRISIVSPCQQKEYNSKAIK